MLLISLPDGGVLKLLYSLFMVNVVENVHFPFFYQRF